MRPGKLDQRITLQSYTEAADGGGGLLRTWANFASVPSVWAHVLANSGRETMEEGRTNAMATTTFFIRNRSDVTEKDRILWRSEVYNIRHVMRQGVRDMYLKLVAERGVSTGEG